MEVDFKKHLNLRDLFSDFLILSTNKNDLYNDNGEATKVKKALESEKYRNDGILDIKVSIEGVELTNVENFFESLDKFIKHHIEVKAKENIKEYNNRDYICKNQRRILENLSKMANLAASVNTDIDSIKKQLEEAGVSKDMQNNIQVIDTYFCSKATPDTVPH